MSNTVSVAANSMTVNGTLTSFVGYAGDTFNCNGLSVPIASVDSTSQLTLAYGWPGVAVTGGAKWSLMKTSPQWSSAVQIHQKTTQLLARIAGGWRIADAAGPLSSRALYDAQPTGFSYLAADTAPFRLYVKLSDTSGDWSPAQNMPSA